MKLLNINERGGNYREIVSNQNEIPKALQEDEPIRINIRRNNPFSLSKKEDDFMFFKSPFSLYVI